MGKAQAEFLGIGLWVGTLVLGRIRHRYRRAIVNEDATSFPKPIWLDTGFQRSSGPPCHLGDELFRQALSSLAVSAGLCRARVLSLRNAMRDQAGNCRPARRVCAQDLTQEDPQ